MINIGVDLHKHQFTNYYLYKKEGVYRKYSTNNVGISQFKEDIKMMLDKGFMVRVAVESTGNTRYFKNEIEKLGIKVIVVNTLKFKVVNQSVKKTWVGSAPNWKFFNRTRGSTSCEMADSRL